MNKIRNLIVGAAALFAMVPAFAMDVTLTPGSFAGELLMIQKNPDSRVVLKGKADVTDLLLLRGLPAAVRSLDMSDLEIVAYSYTSGGYRGRKNFSAGELPFGVLLESEIEEVVLPASTSIIGERAFAMSAVKEIVIPSGVTRVDDYAFASCPSLDKVVVSGIPEFGAGVFRKCTKLAAVECENGLSVVPDDMFYGCTSLTAMPAGVNVIGVRSFLGTGIDKLSLSGVASVGDYAFADNPRLSEISLPSGGISFGKGVFAGSTGLESVDGWLAEAPEIMFLNSGTSSVGTVDSAVIDGGWMANNTKITKVVLGSSVREIQSDAFRNASGLTEVNVFSLGGNLPTLPHDGFSGLENKDDRYDIILAVNEEYIDLWSEDPEWGRFNVQPGESRVTEVAGDIDLDVNRNGGVLTVDCNMPVDVLQVYTLGGILCYEGGGKGATSMTVDVPENEILVVRVQAGDVRKILKLR